MERGNEKWLETLVESYKKNPDKISREPKPMLSKKQLKLIAEKK